MVGRKCALPPTTVIDTIMKFKDRVIDKNDAGKKAVVVASNSVWQDISLELNSRMSKGSLHTFVYKDYHRIKEKLGFPLVKTSDVEIANATSLNDSDTNKNDSASTDESNSDKELPCMNFIFTFSPEEWKEIQPQRVTYRLHDKKRPSQNIKYYEVLPKKTWSPLVAEHFWVHTRLACCLSFRRAKVSSGSNYVSIVGRCTICESYFKGIVSEKPPENARVLMECTYVGNYNEIHKTIKKRRMIGPTIDKALLRVVDEGMSCENFRENEAVRLMKSGDLEPAILPTGNALRVQKSKQLKANRRNDDSLTALYMMKTEDDYKGVIRDIGCDPFYVHYHTCEQIHLYRSYCQNEQNPKLIIDATGSLIKKFKKFGLDKTNTIYLYEGVVYDEKAGHSFTVTNMLCERHTNSSISNWLVQWSACDVPKPKQTVCDNSLALLSAITQSFTQFSSLQDYVRMCADLLTSQTDPDPHWIPKCFIRIDVAHFIKIACKWVPLKSAPRRVREIILRAIGLMIKSQSLIDIRAMLLTLFVVITNETDGININTQIETACEHHKNKLLQAISTGFHDSQDVFINILASNEDEDQTRTMLEEAYEIQNEGLNYFENPFQAWTNLVYNESKNLIEEGTGINPFYCPSLVPILIKYFKLLPLWSGVMIPIFGFGEEVASSAAVESSFKKLKTLTFKNISLPTDLEIFLEMHINSLKGTSLIRTSTYLNANPSLPERPEINDSQNNLQLINTMPNTQTDSANVTLSNSPEQQNQYYVYQDDIELCNTTENTPELHKCPLCKIGVFPSETGAHKCIQCRIPVHALSTCSNHEVGDETKRICFSCFEDSNNNLDEESLARESWNRKPKKQKKTNSYLLPNPHLRHLHLNNSKNIKSLPLLKNGSRAEELKAITVKDIGKIVLTNTCAFDTIASIFTVAYCDSILYSNEIDNILNSSDFFCFISKMVKCGITASTYSQRANIILDKLNPDIQKLSNINLVVSDSTAANAFHGLLSGLPSVEDIVTCSNKKCRNNKKMSVMYLTYNTTGDLSDLQSYVSSRINTESSICGYTDGNNICQEIKTRTTTSNVHLIIEILKWDEGGNNIDHSTEAAPHIQLQLNSIPEIIVCSEKTFELRGVGCYRSGLSRLRNAVGHYFSVCKRRPNYWEMMDDLKKNTKAVKSNTTIPCEFLIYTI